MPGTSGQYGSLLQKPLLPAKSQVPKKLLTGQAANTRGFCELFLSTQLRLRPSFSQSPPGQSCPACQVEPSQRLVQATSPPTLLQQAPTMPA